VIVLVATLLGVGGARAEANLCHLGRPLAERALLLPRPGSFYSIDALSPDIVKWHGRYLLYFSGNDTHGPIGRWHTGVAVSRYALGPFRVVDGFVMPFLNGGTVAWRGRLWQATGRSWQYPYGDLLVSRDGFRWRKIAAVPQVVGPYVLTADLSLQVLGDRLRLYAIGRREGIELASRIINLDYAHGRWTNLRTLLYPGAFPWEAIDLGEPAVFTWRGQTGLLYTGTAVNNARSTGLALKSRSGGWRRCSPRPLIAAGASRWGSGVSIDAVGLVDRLGLYVYYGAGDGLSLSSDLGGGIGVRVYRLP
jgi:hypothetical protein